MKASCTNYRLHKTEAARCRRIEEMLVQYFSQNETWDNGRSKLRDP